MPWGSLSGHQAYPGGRTNGVGICLRKEPTILRQLLHVWRTVQIVRWNPFRFSILVKKRYGGVPHPHVIHEKEKNIGSFLSFGQSRQTADAKKGKVFYHQTEGFLSNAAERCSSIKSKSIADKLVKALIA
jgi:hypothetical protein